MEVASLGGVRGVDARALRQQKLHDVGVLLMCSMCEERRVPVTGRLIEKLAQRLCQHLGIWVTARCHPGLNRCQVAIIDRVDYLWRRDDYLLHRLRRAAAASLEGAAWFLLCAMGGMESGKKKKGPVYPSFGTETTPRTYERVPAGKKMLSATMAMCLRPGSPIGAAPKHAAGLETHAHRTSSCSIAATTTAMMENRGGVDGVDGVGPNRDGAPASARAR